MQSALPAQNEVSAVNETQNEAQNETKDFEVAPIATAQAVKTRQTAQDDEKQSALELLRRQNEEARRARNARAIERVEKLLAKEWLSRDECLGVTQEILAGLTK